VHLHHRLRACLREQQQQRHTQLERSHARLLARHPQHRLQLLHRQLAEQAQRLRQSIERRLERNRLTLSQSARALHAVSPLATLERGYAIVFDADGKVLRSVQNVPADARLRARLADGELPLRVERGAE
jgi:exodeoxyribonuclease VII large subunit